MKKVSDNVPLPSPPRSRWPLSSMKVGDSFPVDSLEELLSVRVAIQNWKRAKPDRKTIRFETRQLPEENGKAPASFGRVWRAK